MSTTRTESSRPESPAPSPSGGGREPSLRRVLSLPVLVLYGIGTTVGAGAYALMGEVAARAGMLTPLAFVLSALLASASALSFSELSSRYPRSAGEAEYLWRAFGRRAPATLAGLLVILAGSVSAATIANGFVGYWSSLIATPRPLAILLMVGALGGVAAYGIRQSALLAAAVTVAELGGLGLIAALGLPELVSLPERLGEFALPAGGAPALLSASVLAFYAYLGFEDMVNVAEEVRDAPRVMPRAILWTLAVTTVVYLFVALACVLIVPPAELATSAAPLSLVFERATGLDPWLLGAIGVVAMLNGALIQMIMASRILYGLARQGAIPAGFARVAPRTQTPLRATLAVTVAIAVLALAFPLAPLAVATSLLTLTVFAGVNLALFWIELGLSPASTGPRRIHPALPLLGALASGGVALYELAGWLG